MWDRLPVEVHRLIYAYDRTYHSYFQTDVLPEMMEEIWKHITYYFFQQTGVYRTYIPDSETFEEDDEEDDE